jgi:hypothetical protein
MFYFDVVRTNDHPQLQNFGRVEECTRKNGGIEIHYGRLGVPSIRKSDLCCGEWPLEFE